MCYFSVGGPNPQPTSIRGGQNPYISTNSQCYHYSFCPRVFLSLQCQLRWGVAWPDLPPLDPPLPIRPSPMGSNCSHRLLQILYILGDGAYYNIYKFYLYMYNIFIAYRHALARARTHTQIQCSVHQYNSLSVSAYHSVICTHTFHHSCSYSVSQKCVSTA